MKISSGFLFFIFLLTVLPGHLFCYDLSADTIMIDDGEKQVGKIFIKGDKYRIERQGEPTYVIIRHDLNVMWVVLPDDGVYVELTVDPKMTPRIRETSPNEISRKPLGPRMVDGHPSEGYEITVKEGPRTEIFYQWTATDINFPIRTEAASGEWLIEFRNIRTGIGDSLFEVPEGYERAGIAPKRENQAESTGSSESRAAGMS